MIQAADERRLETLSDDAFEVLLNFLDERPGNCVRRIAELVRPYVEDILDGKDHAQDSRLQSVRNETLENLNPSALITSCEELLQSSG